MARKRLTRVIGRHGAALARTIEQKISDAGPSGQRIDPHILTPVRNTMVREGDLVRHKKHGVDWYSTPDTPTEFVEERIEAQFSVYRNILEGEFNGRLGQVLEIAVFRALQEASYFSLGGFRQIPTGPSSSRLKKEEPPSILSTRELSGNRRFDFIVGAHDQYAGIEIKNVREWLYPDRQEIIDLLSKSIELDIVPTLIARRIPYATRRILSTCGCVLWETRRQYYPPEYNDLAEQVRQKTMLGYFDINVSDFPDPHLHEFITRILPEEIPEATDNFRRYSDLTSAYSSGEMSYREFAARVRRREAGTNEDSDDPDVPVDAFDIPF